MRELPVHCLVTATGSLAQPKVSENGLPGPIQFIDRGRVARTGILPLLSRAVEVATIVVEGAEALFEARFVPAACQRKEKGRT
jgi:hypothetical protein